MSPAIMDSAVLNANRDYGKKPMNADVFFVSSNFARPILRILQKYDELFFTHDSDEPFG